MIFFHKILESQSHIALSVSHCTVINFMSKRSKPKIPRVHDLFRSVRRRWLLHRTVRHHPQAAVLPAHNTALICDSRDRQGPGHCRRLLNSGHLRVRRTNRLRVLPQTEVVLVGAEALQDTTGRNTIRDCVD